MPEQPTETVYDVAIIGGGIAGAAIARDAALRGLGVILFEKNTFGSGTSSKSSRLIHGGIRYLETAWKAFKSGRLAEAWKNLRFVFLSLRESRILRKIAPDLVKPIPIVIPILGDQGRNRPTVFAGCLLYYFLGLLSRSARRPRLLFTKKSVLRLLPQLNETNLKGGVILWDHLTDDKRLVEQTIHSAIQNGARALEHAKVIRYQQRAEDKLYEIQVETNQTVTQYSARTLVNASGPWVDKVRALTQPVSENYLLPVAGAHVTFKKFIDYSVILQAEDHRFFFVINSGDTSRVGTTERLDADPDNDQPSEEEVNYLMRSLRIYFPALSLDPEAILNRDSGIRPLVRSDDLSHPSDISREHEIKRDTLGIFHVLGVKLTDHRRAAEETVDLLLEDLGNQCPKARRKTTTHRLLLGSSP